MKTFGQLGKLMWSKRNFMIYSVTSKKQGWPT